MVEFRFRLTIVAAFLLALAGCGENASDRPAPPPPAVTVTPATMMDIQSGLEFVGQTEAIKTIELRARVSGVLESRNFTEGQDVEEGQLLFQIERAPYLSEVHRLEAETLRHRAGYTEAKQELERANALFKSDTLAKRNLDKAVNQENEARAAVKASDAALERAQLDLEYTEIHSPVAGRIGRVLVNVGNLVGPESGPLATISTIDPIFVNFTLSETFFLTIDQEERARVERGGVSQGLFPTLRLSNGSMYAERGTFDFIDKEVNQATGSIAVRAVFDNPDTLLRPGQYVTVVVRQEDPESELVVPQSAIKDSQQGRFVLIVNDEKKVQRRDIITGTREGRMWVVESGLEPGELVIVKGLQKVRPGIVVNPIVEAAPSSPTSIEPEPAKDIAPAGRKAAS